MYEDDEEPMDGLSRRPINSEVIVLSSDDEADPEPNRAPSPVQIKREKRDFGLQIISNDMIRQGFMSIGNTAEVSTTVNALPNETNDEYNVRMAAAGQPIFNTSTNHNTLGALRTIEDTYNSIGLDEDNDLRMNNYSNQYGNVDSSTSPHFKSMHHVYGPSQRNVANERRGHRMDESFGNGSNEFDSMGHHFNQRNIVPRNSYSEFDRQMLSASTPSQKYTDHDYAYSLQSRNDTGPDLDFDVELQNQFEMK